jgi:hypothetical protein
MQYFKLVLRICIVNPLKFIFALIGAFFMALATSEGEFILVVVAFGVLYLMFTAGNTWVIILSGDPMAIVSSGILPVILLVIASIFIIVFIGLYIWNFLRIYLYLFPNRNDTTTGKN